MEYLTRATLRRDLEATVVQALDDGAWSLPDAPEFWVRRARPGHGDFASNVALVLGAAAGVPPGAVATVLRHYWEEAGYASRFEEAKGFLNFRLDDDFLVAQIERANREGARYGAGGELAGARVNVEFVSADPTGPLPFSSGRIAACGETLCRVLEFQGADVTREFYLNDVETSSKMRLLGESVAAFYLSGFEREFEWPEGAWQDAFVRGVAAEITEGEGNRYLLVPDAERAAAFAHAARDTAVALQKRTLQEFGVRFDVWTSESVLGGEGRVDSTVRRLQDRGLTFTRDGALWLRTTAFGDESDRPLVRANGVPTYLASDIAYHVLKMERGFDLVLNIWTAQHSQYVGRTRAALRAAGCDADKMEVLLCEGARYLDDGTLVTRGKGGGPFTLGEALREVGRDTLRFDFLRGGWDETLDIDAEQARRDDETNPAYAARLLPTRLRTMIGELEARAGAADAPAWTPQEREVARLVALWPDEIDTAARRREPQRVARFVSELAAAVHALLVVSRPGDAPAGRLPLLRAAQSTAGLALGLLGIDAEQRV